MVKLVGHHHVRAMRAFVQRRQAFQEHQLVKEKEATQRMPLRELPEYDPDDNGRFAGYDAIFKCEGNHYEALCRVLKKILRPAHYRTWSASNGELVNDPAPCFSAKEIARRVGRHRRTIEIDLQEMRQHRLLHLQPVQRGGRWVMEMHYDVLYRLAYEYLEWERSADYIPPERQYFERMEIDPDLRQRLLQFEDYRKVLVKKKPGPKVKVLFQSQFQSQQAGCQCTQASGYSSEGKYTHETRSGQANMHQEVSLARTACPGAERQHICSDAPILPAASQGGMNRSVNLEPPAPPTLPQAGVSGGIHPEAEQCSSETVVRPADGEYSEGPMAPVEPCGSETGVSDKCQHFQYPDTGRKSVPISAASPEGEYTDEIQGGQVKVPYENNVTNDQCCDEYTEDGAYIYRAILPPPMQEIRMDRNGARSIFLVKSREVPYLEDEQGTLYFAGSTIPQLYSDLMVRKRKEYFITSPEFGPEIGRLFDADAAGAAVSLGFSSPEAPEEDEIVMRVLFSEPIDDEPQENAEAEKATQADADDDELKFAYVWTPELQYFLRHERPGLAYFVPLTDFPPEEQRKLPGDAVGLWIWKDPETWQVNFDACFEWYMQGIAAQPEFEALAQANARYRDTMSRHSLPSEEAYEAEPQEALPRDAVELTYASVSTFPTSQVQGVTGAEPVAFSDNVVESDATLGDEYVACDASVVLDEANIRDNNLRVADNKGHVDSNDAVDETVRQEAFYEKETEKLSVVAPSPASAANQDHDRRHQPGRPAASGPDRRETHFSRERTRYRQRDDVRKSREYTVNSSSVFSYGAPEIVHGGEAGATYPAILPLLRDFMQKKLLGGDAAMRYFIAYDRLGGALIGNAFPPGTDGVWIWRQDPEQSIHIKPTCSTLDPALKNRNLSSLPVAVGRLSDDDGSFYFNGRRPGRTGGNPAQPDRQHRSYDTRSREAPPSPESGYGRDDHGGKVPVEASHADEYGRRRDGYGGKAPTTEGIPARQQAQDMYRNLLKRAKDGNGKGFQRLF